MNVDDKRSTGENRGEMPFGQKLRLTIGSILLVLLVIVVIWLASDILFLVFGTTLFAIFLRALAGFLHDKTGLSQNISLAVVLLILVLVISGAVWLLAPELSTQLASLSERLPESIDRLESSLRDSQAGSWIVDQMPSVDELISGLGSVSRITGIFTSTFGLITNVMIGLIVAIYLAYQPEHYKSGLISLFPKHRRRRVREIINEVIYTLKWWMVGQVSAMLLVGILTSIGLMLLGIPLALTLGIITMVLTFIPNFGPVSATIPPALLGLMEGPDVMLYVILLYLGIQIVESYMITPQIQRKTVSLPPAFTILFQIFFGLLFGITGLLFATPLAAVVLVVVKMAYIEDVLHDESVLLPSEMHTE